MSESSDDWRRFDVDAFIDSQEFCDNLVIYCVGLPVCPFKGKTRTANSEQGCPNCRRVIFHRDGSHSEYRTRTH